MTMTAREAMQAMLEGGTVYCSMNEVTHEFKLTDEGTIVARNPLLTEWLPVAWMLNGINGVVGEYPLTFEEALKAMLDGRTVMRENSDEHAYRFRNGTFESSTEGDCFTEWESCTMFASIQKVKWKVVE